VIAPRMNVGLNVLWYDATNLRNSRNQAAHNSTFVRPPTSMLVDAAPVSAVTGST